MRRKKLIAVSIAAALAIGSVGNPLIGMNQIERKWMAETTLAKVEKSNIKNQTISSLNIPGKLLKGKQKIYTKAFSLGTAKKMNGKYIALAKSKEVTIVGQKVQDGVVWYQVSLSQNQKNISGYLSSKVVALKLKDKTKAKVNSTKQIQVRKGASSKKAYIKQNGKKVSLKNGTEVFITKESNTKEGKWFKISFTYNGKNINGYIEANKLVFVKENGDFQDTKQKSIPSPSPKGGTELLSPSPMCILTPYPVEPTLVPSTVEPILEPSTMPLYSVEPTLEPSIMPSPGLPTSSPGCLETPLPETPSPVPPTSSPGCLETPLPATPSPVPPTLAPSIMPSDSPVPSVPTGPTLQLSYENGINQFGYQMLEQLGKEDKNENTVISPYSIVDALLMLANGADGSTKAELEKVLGIDDLEAWNEGIRTFLNRDKEENVVINVSNSIWTDQSLTFSDVVEKEYLGKLATAYQAEKKVVDFKDTEKTKKIINDYVFDKTEGMIKDFLDKIPNDTVIMLLNTLYFNGEWSAPFHEADTKPLQFKNADGSKNVVDMMSKLYTSVKYLEKEGLQGVELPYGDGNVAMDLILSTDESVNTASVFEALSATEKEGWLKELSEASKKSFDSLGVPKFKIKYGTKELNTALEAMGLQEIFSDFSDFSKMKPNETSFSVGSVMHQTVIEVGEKGTKAAAATGIACPTSIIESKTSFIVNRSFVFVIKDVKTGMILFMGTVNSLTDDNKVVEE